MITAMSTQQSSLMRPAGNPLRSVSRPSPQIRAHTKAVVPVRALFGGSQQQGGGQQQWGTPPQQQGGLYPNLYQPPPQELAPDQREKLRLGTALRNIGWLSFWSQLALSTVSGVILLFSTGLSSDGALAINPMDICTMIGVVAGFICSFVSWTVIRAGRKLSLLQEVKVQQCVGAVLASTNLNLVGMGATILGLQATVGSLVGKTLTTAAGGYYGPGRGPPPVAFDVFSVQACANTIMAHFAGLVLAQWLLRVLNQYMKREEELAFAPTAPSAPGF